MASQKKSQASRNAKESPINLLLTGVICLSIGLAIGYYFGRQISEVGVSSGSLSPQPAAPQGQPMPVQDAAAFVQNEASLKTMVAANPKDLNALIQLGNLYYDHSRFEQAIDYYGKALEIDPGNANVRTDRGTSYWNLNKADLAIAEFQKSLEVDSGHAQTLYNMGVVYLHGKNDIAGARKAWQTLLAKNPGYPDRTKVEQQLASLAGPPPAAEAPPAGKPVATPAMQDLLDRIKSRP